ncbi:MAG: hypothetical protein JO217_05040 [Acidobacteriaceae bacterium]|nr:hypothetical protein [Acidobacteriaceae bacterium]MBV9442040.1 hypothetical protein [Acidobacteriaceae bacterium]
MELPDPEICYRALESRDSRFDGLLFVGVTSTGIYCRPICPAARRNNSIAGFSRRPQPRRKPVSAHACAADRKPLQSWHRGAEPPIPSRAHWR